MASRVELNDQEVNGVVGGAFNWYNGRDGLKHCLVTRIGDYLVLDSAESRYMQLKIQHKFDDWGEQDYVNQLVAEGEFFQN